MEPIILVGFTLTILLLWSPLLAISSLRELFTWPTRWLFANYILVGAGVITTQFVSYLFVILIAAGRGPITGSDGIAIVLGVTIANFVIPVVIILGANILSVYGYRETSERDLSGTIALGIGVLWYATIASVGFVLIGLALIFANLPT